MRRALVIAFLASVAIAGAAGPLMSRVEQPDYKVERSDGSIEVRDYPPMTVATATVGGSRGAAIQRGFRILADYIFGANDGAKKIEMTAPVLQGNASASSGKEDSWSIRFVMPRKWSKESLPTPRDQQVTLKTMPAARFAVIRFPGFWRDSLLRRKTSELEAYIAGNKLIATGGPIYAFYNPPWTLPIFRRNEIMFEVRPGK